MRRFTGNKHLLFAHNNTTTQLFANSLFNNTPAVKTDQQQKELYTNITNNNNNNNANSNLNPFSYQNDQTNNLILALQGFQMIANRSNVVLLAVGGIVSFKRNKHFKII